MNHEVFEGSAPSFSAALDLFSLPASDVSVLNADFTTYFPISNFKDNTNPIQFTLNSSSSHHFDLHSSFLYFKLKIVRSDGTNLTSSDVVAPSENFFPSLFENVSTFINGVKVSGQTGFYPYLHHIQDLLSFGQGVKDSMLTAQLFLPDTTQDTFGTENKGFVARKAFANLSIPFEISARLAQGIFQQNRYLIPGVEVKIELRRSLPQFCLVGIDTKATPFPYRVEFEEVALFCRRCIVNPIIASQHNKLLSGGKKCQYPMRIQEVKSFTIAKDAQSVISETVFSGNLPEFLVLTFVSSKALLGSIDRSPFNFQHFDLESVVVSVDGDSSIYRNLTFDASKKLGLLGFNTLFTALPNLSSGNGITRNSFFTGDFILVFDLMPANKGNRFQMRKQGAIKIELKFRQPLAEPVSAIILAQFQSLLQLDKERNVHLENISSH